MEQSTSEEKRATRRRPRAERLLEAASDLFYREGIRAVGVDTISSKAGVSKRTLYNRFGVKPNSWPSTSVAGTRGGECICKSRPKVWRIPGRSWRSLELTRNGWWEKIFGAVRSPTPQQRSPIRTTRLASLHSGIRRSQRTYGRSGERGGFR